MQAPTVSEQVGQRRFGLLLRCFQSPHYLQKQVILRVVRCIHTCESLSSKHTLSMCLASTKMPTDMPHASTLNSHVSHLFPETESQLLLLVWAPPVIGHQQTLEAHHRISGSPSVHLICCSIPAMQQGQCSVSVAGLQLRSGAIARWIDQCIVQQGKPKKDLFKSWAIDPPG